MYKVITEGKPTELWAIIDRKEDAERMIADKYWHQYMYEEDRSKTLIVVKR